MSIEKCYLKIHSGTWKFAFDRRDLNCIRRQGALNNYSLLLRWFAAWTYTYHILQQQGSSSAQCTWAACILIRGLAEQTGKGPNASENKVACRFYGQIRVIWGLSHISEKSFPLTKPDFQHSAWKRTLSAVSQHTSCGMTLTQERSTYPAAADSERHYIHHLSSQLEQGQRHSQSICFICCYAAYEGYTDNIHASQNSIYDTFLIPIQFSPLMKNFSSLLKNWRLPYYHMFPFFS